MTPTEAMASVKSWSVVHWKIKSNCIIIWCWLERRLLIFNLDLLHFFDVDWKRDFLYSIQTYYTLKFLTKCQHKDMYFHSIIFFYRWHWALNYFSYSEWNVFNAYVTKNMFRRDICSAGTNFIGNMFRRNLHHRKYVPAL